MTTLITAAKETTLFLTLSLFAVILFSSQINLALSVIYSRHLIAMLLGSWPEGHMITSELLDNSDEVQLIGLLDILQRLESKERFEQVVNACNKVKYCFGEFKKTTVGTAMSLNEKFNEKNNGFARAS